MFDSNRTYTFDELRNIVLKESAEPKLGKNVAEDNKKNNTKAVKDIEKDVAASIKGAEGKDKNVPPQVPQDLNKSTLDYHFDDEPSEGYKERVEANIKGFPSKKNEKSTDATKYGGNDFSGNAKFYNDRKKTNKTVKQGAEAEKRAGLKSHNLPKEWFNSNSIFSESTIMKRLNFKNATFLNESQAIAKVPDEFKIDGNRFIMRDKTGTEFLMECKQDSVVKDYIHVNVVSTINKQQIQENRDKIKRLESYDSANYNPTMSKQQRLNEENEMFAKMMNISKGLVEKSKQLLK